MCYNNNDDDDEKDLSLGFYDLLLLPHSFGGFSFKSKILGGNVDCNIMECPCQLSQKMEKYKDYLKCTTRYLLTWSP